MLLRKLFEFLTPKQDTPLKDDDLDRGLETVQTKLKELEHLKEEAMLRKDYVWMSYITGRITALRRVESEYQVLMGRDGSKNDN